MESVVYWSMALMTWLIESCDSKDAFVIINDNDQWDYSSKLFDDFIQYKSPE